MVGEVVLIKVCLFGSCTYKKEGLVPKSHSELTLGRQRSLCPIQQRTTLAEGGLPNSSKPKDIPEEEPVGHIGVANRHQAAEHQQLMVDALQNFHRCIKDGEVKDVLKQLLEEMKEIISKVYEPINQANVLVILCTTPGPTCAALLLVSEEAEVYLEDIMPEEDIPSEKK